MSTTETPVKQLRINRLTNEQYETAVKSDTELYLTPDTTDTDIATAIATHNSDTTAHSSKQDKLDTQTAYSAKGSATKVPQITTNSLGQVTAITEVTITQPTVNNKTITIQKNSNTVDSFTLNQSSDKTINITVPTTAADVGAVSTADGVTAVVAGSTANKIDVTKNGSTSTITVNNVAKATQSDGVTTAAGTDNVDRVVYFANTSATTTLAKPVFDNDFKYNPSTNVLTVGSITGTAARATADADGNTITTTYATKTEATRVKFRDWSAS